MSFNFKAKALYYFLKKKSSSVKINPIKIEVCAIFGSTAFLVDIEVPLN
jgi:hypothetical protein